MFEPGFFFVIVAAIVAFMLIGFFRQFGRVRSMQNRVFDTIERQLDKQEAEGFRAESSSPRDYQCDQCGASLGDGPDVSPSGDFKCQYCGAWSNIHT